MEIVDSDGLVYPDARFQTFFWQNITPNLGVGAFQNFPRHEKSFTLRVYSGDKQFLAAFEIRNPAMNAPESALIRAAPALPQVKSLGQSEIILEGLELIEKETHPFSVSGDLISLESITPKFTIDSSAAEIESSQSPSVDLDPPCDESDCLC